MDKDLQGYPHRIPTGWSTWLGNNRNVAGQKTRYDLQASRRLGFAESMGACGLQLETAKTNHAGQSLYERLGYVRDEQFYTYWLQL